MYTIDCPQCGAGEIHATVVQDCEGDASVIGGLHRFYSVDDIDTTCGCELTDQEVDDICERLVDMASEPLDPSDDPQFPY